MTTEHKPIHTVFQDAVKNLEKFTRHNAFSTVPHVFNLNVEQKPRSFFKRLFNYFCYSAKLLFPQVFRKKEARVQEELLRSVIIIKKHSQILERFRNGSEEQRKLVSLAQDVVGRYNSLIHQAKQAPASLRGRLIEFMCKRLGVAISDPLKNNTIDLSTRVWMGTAPYQDKKVRQVLNGTDQKVSLLASAFSGETLTQHEMDAFCMKAITMIKNHEIPVSSIRETLNVVKAHPITTKIDASTDGKSAASIVSLSQTVNLFPGEMIEFRGAFKRDCRSNVLSMPIADSFHMSSLSVQNGFPHPSQYHGIGLVDELIPNSLLRLDLMPALQGFYEDKKKIALELLPQGSLINKAKALLKLKKQVFNEHLHLFIGLHRNLAHAIAKRSGVSGNGIDSFFDALSKQDEPYDVLAKASRVISELCIERPYEKLIECWIDDQLGDQDRFQAAAKVLQDELEESMREQIGYAAVLGKAFGPSACMLILQQLSEKIDYAPPKLSEFDHLVQAWLYKQVYAFHRELVLEEGLEQSPEKMKRHLVELLETDIALFQADSIDDLQNELGVVVHLLDGYYHVRYQDAV